VESPVRRFSLRAHRVPSRAIGFPGASVLRIQPARAHAMCSASQRGRSGQEREANGHRPAQPREQSVAVIAPPGASVESAQRC
jgi:hypothetical protein